jgi:hypothetical protein
VIHTPVERAKRMLPQAPGIDQTTGRDEPCQSADGECAATKPV